MKTYRHNALVTRKAKYMKKRKQGKIRTSIKGEVISPGFAVGKAFLYTDILSAEVASYTIKSKDLGHERARIKRAMGHVYDDVTTMRKTLEDEDEVKHANIFKFHQQVLHDKQLSDDLDIELDSELINAENVVRNVFRKLADRFKVSDNKVIQAKADDIDDLCHKLVRVLVGYDLSILEHIPSHSIVVARRLLPSDTVHLKRKNLQGIIVEEGSLHSHSALLARAFGIPAIANLNQPIKIIKNGDEVALDGEKGEVVVHPSKKDRERFERQINVSLKSEQDAGLHMRDVSETKDGTPIDFYVTAYSVEDVHLGVQYGARGIGLYRMEQIYLQSSHLPTVKSLVGHMSDVFHPMQGKEITVRLLDTGGDKMLPYIPMPDEENPFLGLRGVRFLLKHKEILKTQIKAILELTGKHSLQVLVPMVSISNEMMEVRAMINEEIKKRKGMSIGNLKIGPMIETPGAIFNIAEIVNHSDFFSIGTNDLIQYIMAAGRENASVEDYFEYGIKPAIHLIKRIVSIGKKHGIKTYVCGELAGDIRHIDALIRVGVRNLSVSAHAIPMLREHISHISLAETTRNAVAEP